MQSYLWIVLGAAALTVFRFLGRGQAARALLPSSAAGLAGLFAVHLTPAMSALLGINAFTVCVALLLGLPGVIGMLMLRALCLL